MLSLEWVSSSESDGVYLGLSHLAQQSRQALKYLLFDNSVSDFYQFRRSALVLCSKEPAQEFLSTQDCTFQTVKQL